MKANPLQQIKKRDGTPPTYSSPTQSFIAKVASPRRNVSMGNGSPKPVSVSRAPSPPPPEVDWTVAAHELSKILIPADRQTSSCRPEVSQLPTFSQFTKTSRTLENDAGNQC